MSGEPIKAKELRELHRKWSDPASPGLTADDRYNLFDDLPRLAKMAEDNANLRAQVSDRIEELEAENVKLSAVFLATEELVRNAPHTTEDELRLNTITVSWTGNAGHVEIVRRALKRLSEWRRTR